MTIENENYLRDKMDDQTNELPTKGNTVIEQSFVLESLKREAHDLIRHRPYSEVVTNAFLSAAFELGQATALVDSMTSDQVADVLDCSRQWVKSLAKRAGIGRQIGEGRRSFWLFTPADVQKLAEQQELSRKRNSAVK